MNNPSMNKYGSLTKAQSGKAINFTSQVARLAERCNTGDISVSDLRSTKTHNFDAERVIELQLGTLTIEIDIFVRRNDQEQ